MQSLAYRTVFLALSLLGLPLLASEPEASHPVALKPDAFESIDTLVNQAIDQGKLPGAVVTIGHKGKVVFQKAYGHRQL
ncbi:Beta-lactamase-related protein, partial [Rhodopirellula maiorica SM1]